VGVIEWRKWRLWKRRGVFSFTIFHLETVVVGVVVVVMVVVGG
jgi:hypothetical protein